MVSYRVGILTVSDTASSDPSLDRSGPILSTLLTEAGFTDITRDVCHDDLLSIRSTVQGMIDRSHFDLVITTGGTGFGLRDVTPEALTPLIRRQTPALTHALTAFSLTKTPLAALSRGVTGIRKREHGAGESLIVALPGSPKAVKECMEVLLGGGLLGHALELLSGGSGERKHKEMQGSLHRATAGTVDTATDTGCAHHHHHGKGLHAHSAPKPRTTPAEHSEFRTIDPTSGPSLRHRSSPYPLLMLEQALSLIAEHTPAPTHTVTLPVGTELVGHVLAEDVCATTDLPPGPTTNVDGYAVNAAATPAGEYDVVTLPTVQRRGLQPGEIMRINTGQGLPAGTDAVVMVEDTELVSEANGEEFRVAVLAQVDVGENVRAKASDVQAGQVVLRKGTTISALGGEIGTLAFLGRSSVTVYRKPKVAILSTGNELIDPTSSPSPAGAEWGFTVFDANRPSLRAAITGLGFDVLDLGIVTDHIPTTLTALRRGLSEADIVLTTGGTSMGESDLLKPLIERSLSGKIHFGRVAMKPGKPTTFATIGDDKVVFALPGNPASALVTFYVFVLPCLRKWAGYAPTRTAEGESQWNLPKVEVVLGGEMRLDPRPEFHRVVVRSEGDKGLVAYSTGSQRSSGMHSMASANALIALPALSAPGMRVLGVGSRAEAILLGPVI
ncbi:Molybdopterin binding domain protein [Kalmanozyma brasiliensis GHG001]|uniref:MoaB/Mog domain-containing protein n=1 Tax=Kalmanozyma brasiliensis (strain GHG001) TaxID=1365824 RepID=V5EWR8_KALBG|nr:Molybdopterin binding domain protein [Kalmanozyma brasiliensis GHG001]EST06794.1 Molybdopterin binding domain protein [Kalmanozyma brasiliensis GHG001]